MLIIHKKIYRIKDVEEFKKMNYMKRKSTNEEFIKDFAEYAEEGSSSAWELGVDDFVETWDYEEE